MLLNYFEKIIKTNFIQDNESKSNKGVIRGLHFQVPPFEQAKLVRCINGKILDIAVDLRLNSKTYGNYFSIELSSENSFSFEKNLDPFKYIILDGVLSAEEFISLTIS